MREKIDKKQTGILILFLLLITPIIFLCTNQQFLFAQSKDTGKIIIDVKEGEHWNHSFRVMLIIKVTNQPQMAFWLEDTTGEHVATMFLTERIAIQNWRAAPFEDKEKIERKSALPVWVHQHQNGGIMSESTCTSCHDLHEADEKKVTFNSKLAAITGATPETGFTKTWSIPNNLKAGTYIVKAEINHSKDFNDYYNEDAEQSDPNYSGGKMGSGQPSVIWQGKIRISGEDQTVKLKKIGLGHPSGKDGKIYSNFDNIDSALDIVESIEIKYIR